MATPPPTEDLEGEKKGPSLGLIIGGVVILVILLALAWACLGSRPGRTCP